MYPDGFIEEMRRTLTLLFPQHDRVSQRWLQTQRKTYNIDRQLGENGQLRLDERQLKNFRYWHDRLVILKQAFDESRPATSRNGGMTEEMECNGVHSGWLLLYFS
jgi:hypothetical protein